MDEGKRRRGEEKEKKKKKRRVDKGDVKRWGKKGLEGRRISTASVVSSGERKGEIAEEEREKGQKAEYVRVKGFDLNE